MAIKVEHGEHNFRKPACLEYCYIDKEYCPLYKMPKGESGSTSPLKVTIKRWTDVEEGKSYKIDYSGKMGPEDQLPKLTKDSATIPKAPNPPDMSKIPDFAEKSKNEHESFTPFSCWGDGSGFEYDIMPENLIGPGSMVESLYDLSYYPIVTSPLQLGDWNTWVDKYQIDTRFGQVSDLNAETILFPNVDDPWMFTEYVFKGTKAGEVIVEPPLYDETTLELKNADMALDEKASKEVLAKYDDSVTHELSEEGSESDSGDEPAKPPKEVKFVKSYRQVCHWDELNGMEDRRSLTSFSVPDSGGKLYRVDVPVQCVKWGEHGNIPPNTINMGAPEEWMDITKSAAKIRPKYVAHIGVPYYANSYGVVYWKDRDAYIEETSPTGPTETKDGPDDPVLRKYYTYAVKEVSDDATPPGIKQNTPKNVSAQSDFRAENGARIAETYLPTGSLSHGGCQLLKSRKHTENGKGICYCETITTLNLDDPDFENFKKHFDWAKCSKENKDCPKFVAGPEYPVLADFQSVAYDRAQYNEQVLGIYSGEDAAQQAWADNFLSNSTGLPMADMFLAMGFGASLKMGRPDVYNPTEVHVWYEAQFEVVYESKDPVRLNRQMGSDGFGRGVQVLRGTGKMALDTYENSNAFKGDTVFFGDIDQMGFARWFETPMFCAKAAYCNDICGISMQSGWDPLQRAGSSEGACRYYRSANTKGASNHIGCPTTCVQKRAYEFQKTMTICSPVIVSIAEMWKKMSWEQRKLYNENPENTYYFEKDPDYSGNTEDPSEHSKEDQEYSEYNGIVWKVWTRSDSVLSTLGGIYIKDKKKAPAPPKKEGEEEQPQQQDPGDIQLFAKIHIGENPVLGFFWYQSMDNAGAAKDVWFCKCDLNYVEFNRNTLIITNEDKFIGGYHPQYKDYSKIGPEYLMDVESDSYRDAMGDIIGDVDYDGQPQATNKQGYWTDQSGDYIVDEQSTGTSSKIADDDSRANAGSPVTISFRKSNTSVDTETGKTQQAKTVNCAVHSNDPYSLMEEFSAGHISEETGKREGRPMLEDPTGDDRYWAPPYVSNRFALPTMRMAAYCKKCDYYIAYRFHDMLCPWCGERLQTITGDRGEGMDVGSTWPESASVIKKFFKLNAIGKVQVWAPPGTCVPLNGYYWKNPTVVTNTLISQIKYRLGSFQGSSWQGDGMSAAKEFSLGYPEQLGYFVPIPDFKDAELDKAEVYGSIKWEGVSKEYRHRYASYNDIMPKNPLPGFVTDGMAENVIAPYTSSSHDALKMVTVSEIIALRNRIEPVLAYCSDLPSNGDFPRMRASFEKRTKSDVPRYIAKAHCRVPSVILAANDSGIDSYVQFYSGDQEWGTVREYYPPGLSWWWLNQVIGGRYSDLTGGIYHMDGKEADGSPYRHSGGNRTLSKCAMFLHGVLPLDKEIMAAYVLVSPAGEPSKEPIGRGWNGVIHYDHYHARTEKHFNDGCYPHLHGQAGFKGEFDSEGNYTQGKISHTHEVPFPIVPQDESDYYEWGPAEEENHPSKPIKYRSLYVTNFLKDWTGLPGVRDEGFWKQYGAAKVNGNTSGDPIEVYDGDLNEGLVFNGRKQSSLFDETKFKIVGLDKNGNLRQNIVEDDIWQTKTQSEFQSEADKNLTDVEFYVSDGTRDGTVSYDFQQFSDEFVSSTLPEQMQSIPGYFDFSGVNSEKRLSSEVDMESKSTEGSYNKPVIVQGESGSGSSGKSGQAGIVGRTIDVTSVIKSMYNDRIERRFYCQAGKTLDEVSKIKFEEPKWEGVGKWEKQEEAKKWNEQQEGTGFVGYILNDTTTMPKLDSDRSIPEPSSEGDKYELQPSGIQINCTFMLPFTIKKGNTRYWIVFNSGDDNQSGADGESKKDQVKELSVSENERITTTEKVKTILEEMFPGFDVSITSSSSCLIEKKNPGENETVEIKECSGSCYGYFSIPTGNVSGNQDRTVGVTSFVSGYHPCNLVKGQKWYTNSYIFQTQNAIFDLCRAPLEESERDYRYQAPTLNCASCRCPNEDCVTAGSTVGVYAERKGLTFGNGQTTCPGCGADLSGQPGVVKINGDGIYTYTYQESFAADPFITGVEISIPAASFRVSCRSAEGSAWTPLVNAIYDSSNKEYTYYFDGNSQTSKEQITSFKLSQKNWKRARYIQIEIDPSEMEDNLEFTNLEKDGDYAAKAKGDFQNYGLFDWSGVKCTVQTTGDDDTQSTGEFQLSTVSMNDEKTELSFYFKNKIVGEITLIQIKPKKYTSETDSFKVYGFHYKPSDLTMTGGALEKTSLFSVKKRIYQLDDFPTQIFAVTIGKNDSGGIELKEVESKEDLVYDLITKTVKTVNKDGAYEDKTAYSISGGNYFFDPTHNRIYLPDHGIVKGGGSGGDDMTVQLKDFEAGLKGIKENISFYPTKMTVRYWTGSGEPVTLEAMAEGQGPSYQVEKDTITVIENIGNLPDNGKSAKMPDMHGKIDRRKIPWVCYNHIPSTLAYSSQTLTGGYFKTPNLKSTALGKTVDNDKFFVDLFGEYQTGIVGRCRTEVTFYGAPDQVLSGTIWVKAPAYTTQTIDTGSGSITIRERTGGLRTGCLIVALPIKACSGRKSLCYSKPTLVVFARERNPSESF